MVGNIINAAAANPPPPSSSSSSLALLNFGSMSSSTLITNTSTTSKSLRKELWRDSYYNDFNSNVYYPNSSSLIGAGFRGNSTLFTLPSYNRNNVVPSYFEYNLDAAGGDGNRMKRELMSSFCDNVSSTLTKLKASSSSSSSSTEQADQAEESSNNNEVPFIDFLGVGVSSS